MKQVKRIDFSRARLSSQADKYYNEGKLLLSLRFAYKELELYGGDCDVFARLSDIYESMGLHASALNWWYRFLDIADEVDLPDVYEGLAVNYLGLGNETQSAYYYNKLIDVDDTLSAETKMEIAQAFSKEKKNGFRFVYPPRLADYSKEVDEGSRALKSGDCKRAVQILSVVEKGSKDYASAKEMQAVALLLSEEAEKAEEVCLELLKEKPDDIRTLATLAAVYLELGKTEESRKLALRLYAEEQRDTDDLYKVATVCCENGLHKEAYEKFCLLEEKLPFDGRMLYFKAVSAFKCEKWKESELAFDTLCTVYPDAEVGKFYLKQLREYNASIEAGEQPQPMDEPSYFYRIPQSERESRCKTLMTLKECSEEDAPLFELLARHDGYFRWCFDEMDGGDHDLQYLALLVAEHLRSDDFLREALLDPEVIDILKVETLRLLFERNEENEFGVVLCHIYRRVPVLPVALGKKRRKKFLEAYAKVASKFAVISDDYARKIKYATEKLYRKLELVGALEAVVSSDDCACAIFFISGLKELRGDVESVAPAFDAKAENVRAILHLATTDTVKKEEKKNEVD